MKLQPRPRLPLALLVLTVTTTVTEIVNDGNNVSRPIPWPKLTSSAASNAMVPNKKKLLTDFLIRMNVHVFVSFFFCFKVMALLTNLLIKIFVRKNAVKSAFHGPLKQKIGKVVQLVEWPSKENPPHPIRLPKQVII